MFFAGCIPIAVVVAIIVTAPIKGSSGSAQNGQTTPETQAKNNGVTHPNSFVPSAPLYKTQSRYNEEDPLLPAYLVSAPDSNSIEVLSPDTTINTVNHEPYANKNGINLVSSAPAVVPVNHAANTENHNPVSNYNKAQPVLTAPAPAAINHAPNTATNKPISNQNGGHPVSTVPTLAPAPVNRTPNTGTNKPINNQNAAHPVSTAPAPAPVNHVPITGTNKLINNQNAAHPVSTAPAPAPVNHVPITGTNKPVNSQNAAHPVSTAPAPTRAPAPAPVHHAPTINNIQGGKQNGAHPETVAPGRNDYLENRPHSNNSYHTAPNRNSGNPHEVDSHSPAMRREHSFYNPHSYHMGPHYTHENKIGLDLSYFGKNPHMDELLNTILNTNKIGPNYFNTFHDSAWQSLVSIANYHHIMSNPDIGASTIQLANKNGYETETHEVVTEDGFILTHFRITQKRQHWYSRFMHGMHGPKHSSPPKGRPVVALLAGIFLNSDNWLLLGEHSLPLMLVNAGYDVWLLNSRGHNYSKRHTYLSVNDTAFWDHSWHEIGIYDLPASIDHILADTGSAKLTFIGFTAGTTAFFVMLSEKPEYNDKITAMVGYAPLVYWRHLRAINISPIAAHLFSYGIAHRDIELLSLEGPHINFIKHMCKQPVVFDFICLPLLYSEYGWNNKQEERARAPEFLSHTTSFALKQLVHFGQCVDSKRFLKFKHLSPSLNLEEYGSQNPPDYNLNNVKVPVALYYAKLDPLANEQDVLALAHDLPNLAFVKKVPHDYFDYQSFTWGVDAPELVYGSTLRFLRDVGKAVH